MSQKASRAEKMVITTKIDKWCDSSNARRDEDVTMNEGMVSEGMAGGAIM